MNLPKAGKLNWLIRERRKGHEAIGFIIDKDNFGCLVIRSPRGSHLTGHGETWQSKWKELLAEGYMPEKEAKKKKIIPSNWKPPKLKKDDKEMIDIVSVFGRSKK